MVISCRLEVLLKGSRIIWIGQLAQSLVDRLHFYQMMNIRMQTKEYFK